MSQQIAVYNGPGTSPWCVEATLNSLKESVDSSVYKVDTFDASLREDLRKNNVGLLVIPGGNAFRMMTNASFEKQIPKISEFVNSNSGHLMTICAGTLIFARKWTTYLKGELTSDDYFKDVLLNEIGIPLPIAETPSDSALNSKTVHVKWNEKLHEVYNLKERRLDNTFSTFYNMGPWICDHPSEEVLLRYEHIEIKSKIRTKTENSIYENKAPIAAIYKKTETGKIVATGFHPEVRSSHLNSPLFDKRLEDQHCEKFYNLSDSLRMNNLKIHNTFQLMLEILDVQLNTSLKS